MVWNYVTSTTFGRCKIKTTKLGLNLADWFSLSFLFFFFKAAKFLPDNGFSFSLYFLCFSKCIAYVLVIVLHIVLNCLICRYLFLFLKFVASVIPTIEYDYTMDFDLGGSSNWQEVITVRLYFLLAPNMTQNYWWVLFISKKHMFIITYIYMFSERMKLLHFFFPCYNSRHICSGTYMDPIASGNWLNEILMVFLNLPTVLLHKT